ncbi:HlyD family efflux transporter periplasmic adaptor subunit [Sphingomonas oligophenolica]|uniref:HlyD family efflux transporter periplasmic adaptor subunit n=1 Tax=Sphingomonas oligophenolica TaxID=301154 RepID=A0ABU9Y110_9SPHN
MLLLGALVAAIGFLAIGSYARVETASGVVALDTGVASIVPSRAGVVRSLTVSEGQHVRAGDVLMRIRSEEDMIGGSTAPDRVRDALREQDTRLAAQNMLTLRAAAADRERLNALIRGARSEIVSLESQCEDQKRLVAAAESEFSRVQRVAASGFISRRDMDTLEATVLARRQQLAQLEQLKSAKWAELMEAQRSIAQSDATAQSQVANTQSSRAALVQQIAQADLARGYSLTAPVDGTVTALTARIGQPASADQPMLMIVPARARSRAELYVPTSAAGFLAPGQPVRIAVDAFPYDRFGTIQGRVHSISSAAVTKASSGGPIPVYLVTADLPDPSVTAFGRKQPLLPGMTLTARIVTEKRSLLEWLFEPIFAVRNR